MWNYKYVARIDYRVLLMIFSLMGVSFLVLSSMTNPDVGLSNIVKKQLQWFFVGWFCFFLFAGMDYRKLKEFSWILYVIMIVMLLGLYFASSIQRVHRWYRIPFLDMSIQPSEYTKLIIVICLAWFLEKKGDTIRSFASSWQILFITLVPFFLILKQPDLGTALVLYPIMLAMGYYGGLHPYFLKSFLFLGLIGFFAVFLIFSNVVSHESMKPIFTKFMKPYQYERLNPQSYHQRAAQISIAIGGWTGTGWKKGEFSKRGWLPAAHTDSVFSSFAEEFGFLGVLCLLLLFYSLVRFSFAVIDLAKDHFGSLLALGIAVYLAMHIIINIAMMCGFLPISGVPLLLVTYGGNSVITTMSALGILQSIYTRRFMF